MWVYRNIRKRYFTWNSWMWHQHLSCGLIVDLIGITTYECDSGFSALEQVLFELNFLPTTVLQQCTLTPQ